MEVRSFCEVDEGLLLNPNPHPNPNPNPNIKSNPNLNHNPNLILIRILIPL